MTIDYIKVCLQILPVNNKGAGLAPVITPLVFKTNWWEDPPGWAIVTTGRWAFAETIEEMAGLIIPPLVTVHAVEITDEFEAGLGKSWGWALLFCATVFTPAMNNKNKI